jgi:hypothetical protein
VSGKQCNRGVSYMREKVLRAVARCRGRRVAPSGEACGSSRRGELRGQVGLSRSLQRSVNWWHNRPAGRESGAASWRRFFTALLTELRGMWTWLAGWQHCLWLPRTQEEPTTVYCKGVVGGCNYKVWTEYDEEPLLGGEQEMRWRRE